MCVYVKDTRHNLEESPSYALICLNENLLDSVQGIVTDVSAKPQFLMSTKQTVGKKMNIIYTKHLLPDTTERRQPGDSTLIINAVYMTLTKNIPYLKPCFS